MINSIKRFFQYDTEKSVAKSMADQILKTVSPKLMAERRRVLSAKKITHTLEQTFEIAIIYKDKYKSGYIRTAILANNLKWELKKLGYPDDFIAVTIEGLIFKLKKV